MNDAALSAEQVQELIDGLRVLACPLSDQRRNHIGDTKAGTIGELLVLLAYEVWVLGEGFSGKRPFGNSGWQHEVRCALFDADLIAGATRDEWGSYDYDDSVELAADEAIAVAFQTLLILVAGAGGTTGIIESGDPDGLGSAGVKNLFSALAPASQPKVEDRGQSEIIILNADLASALCEGDNLDGYEHVCSISGEHSRWRQHMTLVVRRIADGKLFGVGYQDGLTENCDGTYPWEDGSDVTLREMEQVEEIVTRYRFRSK